MLANMEDLFARRLYKTLRPPSVHPELATAMVAAGSVAHGPQDACGRTHAVSTCVCPPPRKLADILDPSKAQTSPTVYIHRACKAYVLAEICALDNKLVCGGVYLKNIPRHSKCHILSGYSHMYSIVDSSLLCMLHFEGLHVVGYVAARSFQESSTRLIGFSAGIDDMVSSFFDAAVPSAPLLLHRDYGYARGCESKGDRKRTHEEAFALLALAGTGKNEVVCGPRMSSADLHDNFTATYDNFVQTQHLVDASPRDISCAIFLQIMQDARHDPTPPQPA